MKKYSLTFHDSALLTYNCLLPPGLPVHWTIRLLHTNAPCPVFFSAHIISPAYPFHPQAGLACHFRQQLGKGLALFWSYPLARPTKMPSTHTASLPPPPTPPERTTTMSTYPITAMWLWPKTSTAARTRPGCTGTSSDFLQMNYFRPFLLPSQDKGTYKAFDWHILVGP